VNCSKGGVRGVADGGGVGAAQGKVNNGTPAQDLVRHEFAFGLTLTEDGRHRETKRAYR
jgi:hypothetical protein